MRSRVNEIAVNAHERDETDLTEVSVSLVQTQTDMSLNFRMMYFLQVAERHHGRIRIRRNLLH